MEKIDYLTRSKLWSYMTTRTPDELLSWAARYEAQINAPTNTDDPAWLKRRADKCRRLALRKEMSREHKQARSRQSNRPDPPPAG